ncbi:hypothetical protein Trco_002360 [Trichoderma cornu-damae]|uniref:Mucin-7 n=1 Tax=Trichoderma cornu-damae TaxID=654480 RepID=A0A9P8QPP5_9HYPO|nr:hypothetical protein Trco_002360 [Trichoderma cornu-damae]
MSAVKNLRAMFENKGDSSPADDDRGRSLGVSSPSPTPGALSGSPRPLNKVRSSFVAVQRNGVMGLVRDDGSASRDSSARPSLDIDRESASATQEKLPTSSVASISSAMDRLSVGAARASLELQGAVSDRPSHNPDKVMDEETPTGVLSPADPTTAKAEAESAPATESEPEKPAPEEAAPASGAEQAKSTKPAATKAATKPATTKPTAAKAVATKTAVAPKAAATKATPKPAATAAKATADSSRRASARPAQKTAETSAVKRESSAAARSAAAAKAKVGTATTAVKKPQPSKAADSGSAAAAKPRTKSPTKPVSLPSSVTAATASSVSRTGTASGTTQPRQTTSRQSLSRQSVHQTGQPASGARTLKQQPPARARPSIGPPPAKPAREAPKKVKEVDEGFLARMMRPTQASSSKFQEPTTPPKKSGSRPSTAGTATSGATDNSHYGDSPNKKPSPKKATASKPADDVAQKSPSPTLAEEKLAAMPEDEVVQELVKDVVRDDNAPVLPAGPDPLPVEEAAAETANVETVEEVVVVAEEAELTQAAPEPVPEVAEAKVEETPVAEPVAEPEALATVADVPVEPVTETAEEPKVEVAEPVAPESSENADEAALQASS